MVCFSLGSNLGDRMYYLNQAFTELSVIFGNPLMASSVYESEGWGVNDHPSYLNAVVCFNTTIPPEEVLTGILEIERKYGRVRTPGAVVPRTIDIDILFYDDKGIKKENLIIPHPRIKERKFVLLPLAEIRGDYVHPEYGVSFSELLEVCPDKSNISKTTLSLASR